MKIFNCIQCGKEKEVANVRFPTARWCSNKCKSLYNSVIVDCPICNKQFKVGKAYFNKTKNNYCSTKCYSLSSREEKICLTCGKNFQERKKSKRKFCSKECIKIKRTWLVGKPFKKGNAPWNKGLKNPYGEHQIANIKAGWKKIKNDGWKPWNAGLPATPEQRAKLLKMNASQSRMKKPTSLEKTVMEFLDYNNIKYEFQAFIKNKWSCDFYIEDKNLIIEADGEYWHSQPKTIAKDRSKNKYLEVCGFNLLRLPEAEIKSGYFKERIQSWL